MKTLRQNHSIGHCQIVHFPFWWSVEITNCVSVMTSARTRDIFHNRQVDENKQTGRNPKVSGLKIRFMNEL
jgi:hypothetical protein